VKTKNIDMILSDRISKLTKLSQVSPEPIASVEPVGKASPSAAIVDNPVTEQPLPDQEVARDRFEKIMSKVYSVEDILNRIKLGDPASIDMALTLIHQIKGDILAIRDVG